MYLRVFSSNLNYLKFYSPTAPYVPEEFFVKQNVKCRFYFLHEYVRWRLWSRDTHA